MEDQKKYNECENNECCCHNTNSEQTNPQDSNKEETITVEVVEEKTTNSNNKQPQSSIATYKRYYSIVVAIVFALFAISTMFKTFAGIGSVIARILTFRIFSAAFMAISVVSSLIFAAGLLIVGGMLFVAYRNPQDDSKDQFFTVMIGVLAVILGFLLLSLFGGGYWLSTKYVVSLIFLSILALVGLALFDYYDGEAYIKNMNFDNFKNDIKQAFMFVVELFRVLETMIPSGKEGEEEEKLEKEYEQAMQNPTQQVTPKRIRTNRGVLKYLILSILTFGIYDIFYWYGMIRDINIACRGDYEKTPGILQYFLLSVLTCGLIYPLVWGYNVSQRMHHNGIRYGVTTNSTGLSYLVLNFAGWLLCGLGPIIATIHIIKDANKIFMAYNRKNGYEI